MDGHKFYGFYLVMWTRLFHVFKNFQIERDTTY